MSKVAKLVGTIAAVVAIAASAVVTFGATLGISAAFIATAGTVAAVAGAISAIATAVAQATMKPPDAKGSVSQVVIGRNLAVPLMIGRTYAGGLQIYDKANGGSDNNYRAQIMVVSGAGPIDSYESLQADYTTITITGSSGGQIGGGRATGFYNNFLWAHSRKGGRPDTSLNGDLSWSNFAEWGADYKLSGYAAYAVQMKFDKDGKRWASGVPQWGVIAKGIRAYDPRLDGTYPGGVGGHRWDDESSWAWSENPALHALSYARGRFIERDALGVPLAVPVKIAGCGFAQEAIAIDQFVELANICEANGWTVGGMIYEGPGLSKWDNIKRILQAAATEPVWSGGQLSIRMSAPKVSLVTIGLPDLADGEISVQAMKSYRDKVNTVVPRVRLEAQRWEYTQLEAVSDAVYLAEDGETKTSEVQYDLVQNKDQGAELAAYELVNSREFGPITIPVKPYLMSFRPGEAVTLNLPEAGLDNELVVITGRQIDPQTGTVMLTLESETSAKHAFALGQTAVAPPTPTLFTPEELDEVSGQPSSGSVKLLILNSWTEGLTADVDSSGNVTVSAHVRVYADKRVAVTGAYVLASGDPGETIAIYYDDEARLGGVVTYNSKVPPENAGDAFASDANPYRHFIATMTVPLSGTSPGTTGGPPAWKSEWGTGVLTT